MRDQQQHHSIRMAGDDAAAPGQAAGSSRCSTFRRRAGFCVSVSPWITSASCVMVAVGLAVWYIFTKKALAYTQSVAGQLFADARVPLVQHLGTVVSWTTLIGLIVVSCLLGLTMFVSLQRAYQLAARTPATSCGAPGKLSYGSYAALIALLNFGWWLVTIAVSLLLAGSLCWLVLAFATSSAVSMGVRYTPDASLPNAAFYTAAREALDSLGTYASRVAPALPAPVAAAADVEAMGGHIRKFVAASKEVPITVCPTSCLNVGSFYDTLRLPTSCVCSDANMLDVADQAASTWKALVHVLAALALMGLGCLWLVMNLAAEFAHARRDMRELPGRSPTALTKDVVAAIQATPFSVTSSKKGGGLGSPTKATRDQDTARFVALAGTEEFTAVDDLPETVLEPMPHGLESMMGQQQQHASFTNAYELYSHEAPPAAAVASLLTDAPAVLASPSRGGGGDPEPSPSGNSRGATLNSTAQRYAAYRLRAAQAAAAKGSPSNTDGGAGSRKTWVR